MDTFDFEICFFGIRFVTAYHGLWQCYDAKKAAIIFDRERKDVLKQPTSDSKVHGANMGPTWGRQDPGWPHDGPINLVIRDTLGAVAI